MYDRICAHCTYTKLVLTHDRRLGIHIQTFWYAAAASVCLCCLSFSFSRYRDRSTCWFISYVLSAYVLLCIGRYTCMYILLHTFYMICLAKCIFDILLRNSLKKAIKKHYLCVIFSFWCFNEEIRTSHFINFIGSMPLDVILRDCYSSKLYYVLVSWI